MSTSDSIDITRILHEIGEGEHHASEKLLPLVYSELRQLAARQMARESSRQTLQPTALVHEAYLRLVTGGDQHWQNRRHFFSAAAEAMRRILVENARRKQRQRHGGDLKRVDLAGLDVAVTAQDEQLLLVNEALAKLEVQDPESAELIKLRFFVGLPNIQAAKILNMSERTAKRNWAFARAWLFEEIRRSQ
ncbi:MAG: sigma-70 family RNA polymerase sigma factor [Verrucomicrobiota bacterium]|nr:sigma-70 family RNA polymerase sigma factor [Verrucomicrobiota bacterium]